jgi:hypothetical protein
MTTAEDYIASVVDTFPRRAPMRAQIAMELRGHISERMEHGSSLDEVLRQLGDPATLADSYLSAVPLEAAPAEDRIMAKLIDAAGALVVLSPVLYLCARFGPPSIPTNKMLTYVALFGGCLLLGVYTAIAESRTDRTFGKRMMRCRVALVTRGRFPERTGGRARTADVLQVISGDALFAFFTDGSTRLRAASKTRVVLVPREETGSSVGE